jgi:hypothetical protein
VLMKFLQRQGYYVPGDKIVRVKSWLPVWDKHEHAIGWPTLLVDRRNGRRETSTPIWHWRKST